MSLARRLLNGLERPGFTFLALDVEKAELYKAGTFKLKYEGLQRCDGLMPDYHMWTLICPGNPFHMSTRSLEGLRELGVIKWF